MSLSAIKDVASALEDSGDVNNDFLAVAADRLPMTHAVGQEISEDSREYRDAAEKLRQAVARQGWHVRESAPAWRHTVRALAIVESEWMTLSPRQLDAYLVNLGRLAHFRGRGIELRQHGPRGVDLLHLVWDGTDGTVHSRRPQTRSLRLCDAAGPGRVGLTSTHPFERADQLGAGLSGARP